MQIFIPAPEAPGGFEALAVEQPLALGADGRPAGEGAEVAAWLVPCPGGGQRRGVALVAAPGRVRVNGADVLPVTVLRRGDALSIGPACLYYTDEAPLRVVPFEPAGGEAGECARCHGAIAAGDPVVACPSCGTVYMAQPDRSPNCWAYGPCLSCGRDTGVEHAWRPSPARASQPWPERAWRSAPRGEAAHA